MLIDTMICPDFQRRNNLQKKQIIGLYANPGRGNDRFFVNTVLFGHADNGGNLEVFRRKGVLLRD